MPRTILIGWSLLTLASVSASAHVERVGFDNTKGSVRYCGNKHADESDVEDTARHDCSAAQRFAVLDCTREQIGSKAWGTDFGSGVSVTNSHATYGVCCDVKCGQ
jgi:hypothetical protein